MADRRISHARGKGVLNHNNRNFIYKNVDTNRIKDNVFYIRESLDVAYQKCFGAAVLNYNVKQKRADRKIEDYYKHLFGNSQKDVVATSSNKEKSFYEIVVGIGDKNSNPVGSAEGDIATKALDEYAKGFSERNHKFYVFNLVMHLDEKTPHLHINYIPVANGYKSGLEIRNSQSIALQQMGFGKNKNSINEWRIRERKILRAICEKYGLEISEETPGRGKTFTPDEYKRMRDEAKEEMRADHEITEEIKEELRIDFEEELVAEQQYLLAEIKKCEQEFIALQNRNAVLQREIKQAQINVKSEQDKVKTEQSNLSAVQDKIKTEQKNFSFMQSKFQPRKDDLEKINRITQEAKPSLLGDRISATKEDWDFIIGIARQHAKISDTTLAALEKHSKTTEALKRCQSLYLAVASEVAALNYPDRSKLTNRVSDVLKDIEDWRAVTWLMEDMAGQKPSDLEGILKIRQDKISKQYSFAKKVQDYNQPNPTPQKTKKKSYDHDR